MSLFKKSHRLSKSEFKTLFQKPLTHKTPLFKFIYQPKQVKDTPLKIAVMPTKKLGHSVNRNYSKRLIKSIVSSYSSNQHLQGLLGIIAYRNLKDCSYNDVKKFILNALSRLETIQKRSLIKHV